ncbi:MAG: hypothetical protein CMQ20_15985 [Gammaproteobacteria bacterium]|nr:hypothetical protein [Gammaproteobacteria bacterium]
MSEPPSDSGSSENNGTELVKSEAQERNLTSVIMGSGDARTVPGFQGDISEPMQTDERSSLEQQIQDVQKLENLEVMAGGVAHDLNNILMSILGNADLALNELALSAPARRNIEEIGNGAK